MKNHLGKITVALAVSLVATAGFAGSLKDFRDGKTYKTVKIAGMEWMAENLNFQTSSSKCYRDKPEFCDKYGHLYSRYEAETVCPDGWRLPSREDFEKLMAHAAQKAGYANKAGIVLKSKAGWAGGNGTDALGFTALPAGSFGGRYVGFLDEGKNALFWSSTEGDEDFTYRLYMGFDTEDADVEAIYSRDYYLSVRCIKR